MHKTRILIVEDEAIVARDIGCQLTELGYEPVAQTNTGEEALVLAEQVRPDLVLMDVGLLGSLDGVTTAHAIRERFFIPVVFLTAYLENTVLDRAKAAEPYGYLNKPFQSFDLRMVIDLALTRHQVEVVLRESEQRAQRQRLALASLALSDATGSGDIQATKRMLTETAARTLQVERSSVWLLSANGEQLECIELFEHTPGQHSQGQVLRSGDYPQYFEAIRNQSSIPAEDARTDRRTSEFTQGYLIPLGITSMLDAMISFEGKLAGVVCMEHTGAKRKWHPDEEFFTNTLASLMAQAMTNASRKQAEEALRDSENRFRTVMEMVALFGVMLDRDGRITLCNDFLLNLTGWKREEVLNQNWFDLFLPSDVRHHVKLEVFLMSIATGEIPVHFENEIVTRAGERRLIMWNNIVLRDCVGNVVGVASIGEDITGRRRTEAVLRESEERFRHMADAAFEGLMFHDRGIILDANQVFADMFGFKQASDVVGQDLLKVLPLTPESREIIQKRIRAPRKDPFEIHACRADGTVRCFETQARDSTHHGRPARAVALRDITERKEAESLIQESLREKEVLLKEIHHRVKNNLQVISSLLSLQSSKIDNIIAQAALKDMQNRVRSMSLIHEHLYRSKNLAQVDMAAYLKQLCTQLHRAMAGQSDTIQLHLDLAPILLGIDQAIPCGLLVNELVSNAFKHGFPERHTGEVRVELQPGQEGSLHLRVSDNGVGMPAEFVINKSTSLGMRLVFDLSRQIGGQLEMGPGPGAEFKVAFIKKNESDFH